jgi:hypothetical protein
MPAPVILSCSPSSETCTVGSSTSITSVSVDGTARDIESGRSLRERQPDEEPQFDQLRRFGVFAGQGAQCFMHPENLIHTVIRNQVPVGEADSMRVPSIFALYQMNQSPGRPLAILKVEMAKCPSWHVG